MSAIQPSPKNILDILRDYERRIRELETSQRAGYTSIISGRSMEVLNNGGTKVGTMGTNAAGTCYGHEVVDTSGNARFRVGANTSSTYGAEVLNGSGSPIMRMGKLSGGGYGIERYDGFSWGVDAVPDNSWWFPSLLNSWVNFDSTNWNEARYARTSSGIIVIEGLIYGGTVGATAFTLPAGYRPGKAIMFAQVEGTNGIGRLDIQPSGNVVPVTGSNSYFSLSAHFIAEQ